MACDEICHLLPVIASVVAVSCARGEALSTHNPDKK